MEFLLFTNVYIQAFLDEAVLMYISMQNQPKKVNIPAGCLPTVLYQG